MGRNGWSLILSEHFAYLSSNKAKLGGKILLCGLFIDKEKPYLCTTPDGLIDDDGIVEVKCPYSAREMSPEEGIRKKHQYYFQVQGQLHITKRKYCIFFLREVFEGVPSRHWHISVPVCITVFIKLR